MNYDTKIFKSARERLYEPYMDVMRSTFGAAIWAVTVRRIVYLFTGQTDGASKQQRFDRFERYGLLRYKFNCPPMNYNGSGAAIDRDMVVSNHNPAASSISFLNVYRIIRLAVTRLS